jgi:predicted dehydrogenase
MLEPVRIGVLGAAWIVPMALLRPARALPGVAVAAVAARDPRRAAAFARRHSIPRVHASYADLLDDDQIDAVYVPLPNSLHAEWSIRALRAGKHVLCEKPLAANAREAEEMAAAARASGRLLCEAMHYRFHPLAARMQQIVQSGCLGAIRHVRADLCLPILSPRNIRYRYDLAGGATMDLGCYAINLMRHLAGAEPVRVTQARAKRASAQIDRSMTADFEFAGGTTGRIVCSMCSWRLLDDAAWVEGEHGTLRVFNPYRMPWPSWLRVRDPHGTHYEKTPRQRSYACQLRAFVAAVRGEADLPVDIADAVATMRVIDAVYARAGMKPRGCAGSPGTAAE